MNEIKWDDCNLSGFSTVAYNSGRAKIKRKRTEKVMPKGKGEGNRNWKSIPRWLLS